MRHHCVLVVEEDKDSNKDRNKDRINEDDDTAVGITSYEGT